MGQFIIELINFIISSKEKSLEDAAGICSVLNCLSIFLHTFIFALSNILLNCEKKEEIKENKKPLFNHDIELK